jgi:hypothetical protein
MAIDQSVSWLGDWKDRVNTVAPVIAIIIVMIEAFVSAGLTCILESGAKDTAGPQVPAMKITIEYCGM